MKTWLIVRTQLEAMHKYPSAPAEVAFLKNAHRHMFKIQVHVSVDHPHRELEFFLIKSYVDERLARVPFDIGDTSCESLCLMILSDLKTKYGENRSYKVEVSEDGENSAMVECE